MLVSIPILIHAAIDTVQVILASGSPDTTLVSYLGYIREKVMVLLSIASVF